MRVCPNLKKKVYFKLFIFVAIFRFVIWFQGV